MTFFSLTKQVDLARLAELANLGSIDEARTQWDQLRQRIDDYVDPAPRKEKKGKGKKKGKKGGDSDSDEEEQEDKNDSPGDAPGGPSKGNGKGDGKGKGKKAVK